MEASGSIIVSGVIDGEDAVNYRLVVKPSGIICDILTGDVTNGKFSVEVMRHVGDGQDEHVQDLSVYKLKIVARAGTSVPDLSGEKKTAVVQRQGDEPAEEFPTFSYDGKFDALIDAFNATGAVTIQKSESDKVYTYLKIFYNEAKTEFSAKSSKLFSTATYPELDGVSDIEGMKGTNKQKYELTFDAMCGWLMAMCLSEIAPSKASGNSLLTNNQTEFFKVGFNYGSPKTNGVADASYVPLYDNYHVHCNPMIGRLAAGAVYARLHDKTATATARTEAMTQLNTTAISAANWSDLGVQGEDTSENNELLDVTQGHVTGYYLHLTNVGYIVNSYQVIPGSPGPFANGHADGRTIPANQPQSLFYTALSDDDTIKVGEDGNGDDINFVKDWKLYNYKVDVAIDEIVVNNYKINQQISYSDWCSKQGKAKNLAAMKACALCVCSDFAFFAKRKVKIKDHSSEPLVDGCFVFETTSEAVTDSNQVYEVSGPFGDLANVMFGSPTTAYPCGKPTAAMAYINKILLIADNCRVPTMGEHCGRRRPLGNNIDKTARVASVNSEGSNNKIDDEKKGYSESRWNGINNQTLYRLFANTAKDLQDSYNWHDWVANDGAKSYASGHSAQIWAAAMMLGQATEEDGYTAMAAYMKAAYKASLLRAVGRYHWNSDIMYGRLFGTMCVPIINAMSGLNTASAGYRAMKAALNGGEGITVTFNNNTGSAVTIRKKAVFVLNNGGSSVNVTLNFDASPDNTVTVANGASQEFTVINLNGLSQYFNLNFASGSNLLFYDASGTALTSLPTASTDDKLANGAGYTVNYGGSGGSEITLRLHNNTGSALTLGYLSDGSYRIVHLFVNGTELTKMNSEPLAIAAGGTATLKDNVRQDLVGQAFGNQWNFDAAIGIEVGSIPFGSSLFSGKNYGPGTYDIYIESVGEGTATGTGSVTQGSSVEVSYGGQQQDDSPKPVISINVRMTNNTGSDILIQNRMRFMLRNEDHNGNKFFNGNPDAYVRTDNIVLVAGGDNIPIIAGDTKTFSNLSWEDEDTGYGLGEASPLDQSFFPIYSDDGSIAYARNVLIYNTAGDSDKILCDFMSSNVVFQEGGTYDLTITSING